MTAERVTLTVGDGEGGRLDRFVAERTELSRNRVQRLVADGCVTVDGRPAKKSESVEPGAAIEVLVAQGIVQGSDG